MCSGSGLGGSGKRSGASGRGGSCGRGDDESAAFLTSSFATELVLGPTSDTSGLDDRDSAPGGGDGDERSNADGETSRSVCDGCSLTFDCPKRLRNGLYGECTGTAASCMLGSLLRNYEQESIVLRVVELEVEKGVISVAKS